MRLGQGCHRYGWFCFRIAVLSLVATTLWGTRPTEAQQGKTRPSPDLTPPPLPILRDAIGLEPNQATGPAATRDIYSKVFNVADLVVPVPHVTSIRWDGDVEKWQSATSPEGVVGKRGPDFETLIKLIQSTIAPESWDTAGGSGSLEPFPSNLSLVVSQSQEVQEEIADLLEQLRRLQDVQITLEARVIGLPDSFFQASHIDFDFDFDIEDGQSAGEPGIRESKHVLLSDIETFFLMQVVQQDTWARVVEAPRITLFNGQTATICVDDNSSPYKLQLQPVVNKKRRAVRMSCRVDEQPSKEPRGFKITDGHTLMINATGELKPGQLGWDHDVGVPMLNKLPHANRLFKNTPQHRVEHVYILVTPRILIRDEKEATTD